MHLTIPAAVSIACVAVNLVFAGLSAGIGWRGGWREMRYLSLVCLTAAGFNACNIALTLEVSHALLRWSSQTSVALAGLHGAAWVFYLVTEERRPLRRYEQLAVVGVLLVSVSALVPGLVISRAVQTHRVEWLDVTYHDVLPTSFGGFIFVVCVSFLLFPFAHFLRRWRSGAPMAWAFVLGFVVLISCGVNDIFAGTGNSNMPYLLDIGFVGLVMATGSSMVHRFVASSRELELVKGELERLVAERSAQLAESQSALARSEKLAAIGNLAAGVAHEINNPAAAVLANLHFLRDAMAPGLPPPSETRDCLDESITSVERIARIVRQLLDAGRVAGGKQGRIAPFSIARGVRSALTTARVAQHGVDVADFVAEDVFALGDEDLFVQVVVNLLTNATQAIADVERVAANNADPSIPGVNPRGRIEIMTERRGDRLLLTVRDTGPGISPPAQARLFEPFFTTKGQGRGTGLGLAVSLGLMRAQGGDLRLHATSSEGTTLQIELPAAEPTLPHAQDAAPAPPRAGLRLLLVDDDPMVLEALRRKLGAWFLVEAVDNVDGALQLLCDQQAFDLVLCDVVMPGGGAARLLTELTERRSSFVDKLLFMTAGAVTPAARAFVEQHRSLVLQKPIEPTQLLNLAFSVARIG